MLMYIAGPYTTGIPQRNTEAAMLAGMQAMDRNWWPVIPHMTHYFDEWQRRNYKNTMSYETFLAWDIAMLRKCDGLFRLPGYSPGADQEVALAKDLGIPVYTDWADVPFVSHDGAGQLPSDTIPWYPELANANAAIQNTMEFLR